MWAAGGGAASKLYTCRSQGISCSTHTHMLLSRMHQADMFPESARYFFSGASSKTFKTISLHYFTVEEVQGNKAAKHSVAHLIADGKEHNDDDIAGLQREYSGCFVSRASILFAGSRKT